MILLVGNCLCYGGNSIIEKGIYDLVDQRRQKV